MGVRVSDPVVDTGLFRLRAFEADWIRPLREREGNQLDALLVEEASHWVLLGQRLGYFADSPSIKIGQTQKRDGFFGDRMDLPASEFARHLSDAQEDLTAERREFLHLILFADDEQFQDRHRQLSELHALIVDRTQEHVAAAVMDDVAWGLVGAESQLVDSRATHPARWRSSDSALAGAAGERAQQRLRKVRALRDRLAAASVMGRLAAKPGRPVPDAAVSFEPAAEAEEVTTLTLGIETLGGIMTGLIERGSPLPAHMTEVFSTASDNQTAVEVRVLLGERTMAADNRSVGTFQMTGIPPAPKGVPQIEVTFEIDRDGHLNVTARDLGTGARQAATLAGLNEIDPAEVETMIRDAARHREDDVRRLGLAEARNKADALVGQVKRMLETPEYEIHDAVRTQADDAMRAVLEAMSSDDLATLGRATDALTTASTRMTGSMRQTPAERLQTDPSAESGDIRFDKA